MKVIYKIINIINNKIYVGQQYNFTSEYLGSGKLIKRAIKKYGINSFKKVILEKISNDKDQLYLNDRETYWINKLNATNRQIGYNISSSGHCSKLYGSYNGMYGKKHTEESKQKMRNNHFLNNGGIHPFFGKKLSDEHKNKLSAVDRSGKNNSFYGKTHSKETKLKISNSRKNKHKGKNHYSYIEIPILQYDKKNVFIKKWNSIYELEKNGFIKHTILRCIKGKNKSSQNYIWKYEN